MVPCGYSSIYQFCVASGGADVRSGSFCARNDSVYSVWRDPFGDSFSHAASMSKICNDLYGLAHTCPPDHTVRSVWRAPALGSVEPPAWPFGVWAAKADQEFLTGSG